MKKVILTGFGPFGPYQFNPTGDIAYLYNGKTFPGVEVIGCVLPCTYYGGFESLSALLDKEKPEAIISAGLSSSVLGIRIETTFRNHMQGKYPDANGYKPDGIRIVATNKIKAPRTVNALADSVSLVAMLRANNIPTELSREADTFFCNSLGYLTSKRIMEEKLPIRNMFIHLPWTDVYQSRIGALAPGKIFLEQEIVHKAIELLIEHI